MTRDRIWTGTLPGALLAALAGGWLLPVPATAIATPSGIQQTPEIEARIFLDRGSDDAYERGERARVYYRVSEDAYVAIFRIDTDGRADLVFPASPYANHYVRGGRDYRLLFSGSPYWQVRDNPGLGYYFIVASPEPLDFSDFDYRQYGDGWDLTRVGRTVYQDPYVAMDEYVARLIPDWEYVPYALDFSEYHVDRVYDYPRFVCYDCHGYRPYRAWNPYRYHCSNFRIFIYNDPYYYPAYRYRGTRVVFVRPPVPRQPRFVFKERARGETGGPVIVSRGDGDRDPVRRRPTSDRGDRSARPVRPQIRPPLRSTGEGDAARPSGRPTLGPAREDGGPARPTLRPGGDDGRTARPSGPTLRPRGGDGPGGRPAGPGLRPTRDPVLLQPSRRGGEGRDQAAPSTRSRGGDRPVLRRRPSAPAPRVRGGASGGGGASGTVRRGGSSGSSAPSVGRGSVGRGGVSIPRPRITPRSSGRSGAGVRSSGGAGGSRTRPAPARVPSRVRSSGPPSGSRIRSSGARSGSRIRSSGSGGGGRVRSAPPSRPRTTPRRGKKKGGGGGA